MFLHQLPADISIKMTEIISEAAALQQRELADAVLTPRLEHKQDSADGREGDSETLEPFWTAGPRARRWIERHLKSDSAAPAAQ